MGAGRFSSSTILHTTFAIGVPTGTFVEANDASVTSCAVAHTVVSVGPYTFHTEPHACNSRAPRSADIASPPHSAVSRAEPVHPLDRETIEQRFPDEPTDLDRDAYDDIFLKLGMDAGVRGDVHTIVSLSIQHAGALAYLGYKDEARVHISSMLGRPELFQYRQRMIERALRSPTYTPEGPVLL